MSAKSKIKVGDRVNILADLPHVGYFKGTVKVVQDTPGKKIGIELDSPAMNGHSLDGVLSAERVDPGTGTRFGRGWWTIEENLEVIKE